jgi:hypothetical protein
LDAVAIQQRPVLEKFDHQTMPRTTSVRAGESPALHFLIPEPLIDRRGKLHQIAPWASAESRSSGKRDGFNESQAGMGAKCPPGSGLRETT